MKAYKESNHEMTPLTKNDSDCVCNQKSFSIKYKLVTLTSLIFGITVLLGNNEKNYNSTVLQPTNNSLVMTEKPEFAEIDLSQIVKHNDGVYFVCHDLIPGTYRVELTDTTNRGYVERYNSAAMGEDDIIDKYTFENDGYFNIEDGDLAVRLQGVKITLQQKFYLFGF